MNRLCVLRRAAGYTQFQLAKRMGISQQTVAKWEVGKSLPRAELLPKLAKLLNCTIDLLLSETDRAG